MPGPSRDSNLFDPVPINVTTMADLRITKAALNPPATGLASMPKAAPSKFDVIRSQIAQKVAATIKLPAAAQPSAQLISPIQSGQSRQLPPQGARPAAELFQARLKNTRIQIDNLTQAVGKLPPQDSSSSLQERLKALEQQFQDSGNLIQNITDIDPKSLLNVQVQLYQLSENIGLMSKVVETASSGMKTVMQTQI